MAGTQIRAWLNSTTGWPALAFAVDCRDFERCVSLLRSRGLEDMDPVEIHNIATTISHPFADLPDSRVSALTASLLQPWDPTRHRWFPRRSRQLAKTLLLIRQRADTFLNARTVLHLILQLLLEH